MSQLDKETVIGGNAIFEEFKGALTEQYVRQQLVSDCNLTPYYWSAENSLGEIDYLAQNSNSVFAIEVKAKENLRSKSLRFQELSPRNPLNAFQSVGIPGARLDEKHSTLRNIEHEALELALVGDQGSESKKRMR